jgi:anti-anti-sigma regulatory factor
MKWRARRRRQQASTDAAVRQPTAPVVLTLTDPLTAAVADELAGKVDRLGHDAQVVIDLTGIPSFDSDGAAVLTRLQDRHGAEQVTIVGLRQATARLTGVGPAPSATTAAAGGWVVRRLRNLAVVQAEGPPGQASADALERPLSDAVEQDVAIVVCDLRGVELTDHGAAALAFASSSAAVRGQELLVVNVSTADMDRLRGIGLSATTYVAPET